MLSTMKIGRVLLAASLIILFGRSLIAPTTNTLVRPGAIQPPLVSGGQRMSEQQAMDRTSVLCREIEPGVRLSLAPEYLPGESGIFSRWTVTCMDMHGMDLASFTWNADTSELFSAGTSCSPERKSAPMSDQEAIWKSRKWLRMLVSEHNDSKWQLSSRRVDRCRIACTVCWRAAGRCAWITMNSMNGQLQYAAIRPLQGRNGA